MYFETDLRVIALATNTTLKRLSSCTMYSCVNMVGFTLFSDFKSRFQQNDFDVIIIDSLHSEACDACRQMAASSNLPIALLVKERETNWQALCSWDVDSYISEEASRIEMIARINAVARRKRNILVA